MLSITSKEPNIHKYSISSKVKKKTTSQNYPIGFPRHFLLPLLLILYFAGPWLLFDVHLTTLVAAGGFRLCFLVPGRVINSRHTKTFMTYPNRIMIHEQSKTGPCNLASWSPASEVLEGLVLKKIETTHLHSWLTKSPNPQIHWTCPLALKAMKAYLKTPAAHAIQWT